MPPVSNANMNEPETNFFGKYELGKLLGCGAFAKVYHARNIVTGQSVAIKAVSKQKILKGGLSAQVKQEISIMRRLRHPNIVKLHEVLATKTKVYFVMEFAKGGELFAKIAKGRFSENLSLKYFQQLISAVGFCHSRGVFHRDLKPENLLLDENWDLKISDFGLSAVADPTCPGALLHTFCGTPAYVAPEILGGKGYDGAKVDLWSCGVILYVLSVGYLPFNDTNLMAMYRKIYKGEFRCPKWTSPDLKHFLSRVLDPNPDTRITIDQILHHPCFKRRYKEIQVKFHEEDYDVKDSAKHLNAFDIISYSSGFDLSGLFNESDVLLISERFVSEETPEKILEKIVQVSKVENVKVVKRKDWGVKLECQNGNLVVLVDIYRLTEKIVVVEVRRKPVDVEASHKIWKDKLRPLLSDLIYQPKPEETSTSCVLESHYA